MRAARLGGWTWRGTDRAVSGTSHASPGGHRPARQRPATYRRVSACDTRWRRYPGASRVAARSWFRMFSMSVSLAMRRSDRAWANSVRPRAMGSGTASTPAEAAPSTAAGFQTWSHRFACGLARPQPAPVEAPPNHGSASMGRQTNTQAHTQHVRNAISAVPGNMLGRTSFKRAISACGSADASWATRKQHVSPQHGRERHQTPCAWAFTHFRTHRQP